MIKKHLGLWLFCLAMMGLVIGSFTSVVTATKASSSKAVLVKESRQQLGVSVATNSAHEIFKQVSAKTIARVAHENPFNQIKLTTVLKQPENYNGMPLSVKGTIYAVDNTSSTSWTNVLIEVERRTPSHLVLLKISKPTLGTARASHLLTPNQVIRVDGIVDADNSNLTAGKMTASVNHNVSEVLSPAFVLWAKTYMV